MSREHVIERFDRVPVKLFGTSGQPTSRFIVWPSVTPACDFTPAWSITFKVDLISMFASPLRGQSPKL
jgi:hypothetical protein